MAAPSVIVVGAGAGGIAASARLARSGFKVTVLEKNDFIGGRCSLIRQGGFRFDQGPSLLLMPELFEETFQDLGESFSEMIELLKCDPNYCVWFADNDTVELSTDLARLKDEIQRYEGSTSFPRFCAFLKEAGCHYDLSMAHVLRKNFPGLLSLLRMSVLKSLISMHPWTTMYGRATKYFRSEKMRRAWTFASMYMGMSPFQAPGTYSLLQYIETVDGIWYPKGGFQIVLQTLADIGRKLGVVYRLGASVESILLSDNNKTVHGVRLSSGEEIYSDIVLVNADLVTSYSKLLPQSIQAKALKARPASCSSISFFWAFDETLPDLRPHNIFLAEEYRESFDAIFKHHGIPKDPSFYVNVPSRIDPTAAPTGKEAVIVLVPVGNLSHMTDETSDPRDWDAIVSDIRDLVLATIENRTGLQDLRSKIIHERYETPYTWRDKFGLDRGAILGLSHSFFNVLCFRPKTKHPNIGGLYFVGASTHPGTGVPICLAGSKLVAKQILQDTQRRPKYTSLVAKYIIGLLLSSMILVFLQKWQVLGGLSESFK